MEKMFKDYSYLKLQNCLTANVPSMVLYHIYGF